MTWAMPGSKLPQWGKKQRAPAKPGTSRSKQVRFRRPSLSYQNIKEEVLRAIEQLPANQRVLIPMGGTLPEIIVAYALVKAKFPFSAQLQTDGGRLRLGGAVIDFKVFLGARPTIVRVMGDYWHSLPSRVLKDAVQFDRLHRFHYRVADIWSEVLFEEGAAVTEGQVLARLDAATAQADNLVAVRSLEAARRNLREIEVRLADAQKTLDRNRNLVQRQLVSQSALDASEAEVAALRARLSAAGAEVGVAEARVAVTGQVLDDLSIRAPFAGAVISKDAQPGETVSPISAGGGFTRTGIATIVDMESREIEVDVNEAYINRVHDGQRVEAVLDAYPDWKVPGHVISIVPTADRQKATVRVHRVRAARTAHPPGYGHQGALPRGRREQRPMPSSSTS